MSDSDSPLNRCFGIFSTRKGSKQKRVSSPRRRAESCINVDLSSNPPTSQGTEKEKKEEYHFGPCCSFSYGQQDTLQTVHGDLPAYSTEPISSGPNDTAAVIDNTIDTLASTLRDLSLKIHAHPELKFHEKYAHDLLTNFMINQGFKVKQHYLQLDTAWRAEYSQGRNGRVIGINSEMDALPGLGHACGHNLIAISGVGVALALKAALQANPHIPGRIVLLGTPAEEGGGGKVILLERGAYDDMDACIMCHPSAGPNHSINIGSTNALQQVNVDYYGHSAHAGAAPWEGTNALDAAFLAYSGISALRQQIKPDHRVHGVVEGKNWQPNVIPDYAKMSWQVRAPTSAELTVFVERVKNCLLAAALATGCRVDLNFEKPYFDLHQNPVLAQNLADIVVNRYGLTVYTDFVSASTDFGNVTYALPALHPTFAIPTHHNGSNHSAGFEKSARSEAAHKATMMITKGLALLGFRILTDDVFYAEVRESFEKRKASQPDFYSPLN